MENQHPIQSGRRNFLAGAIPATCCLLSANTLLAMTTEPTSEFPGQHKFDQLMDKTLTYRENMTNRYSEFIKTMHSLKKEWGEENTLAFLKKQAEKKGIRRGQNQLQKSRDNSFASFVKFLDSPLFENTLSFEYTEKSDHVCEIKVTECLWAEVFKKAGAGDLGYASVCFGDYSHCQNFNPKIKMVRDKTLMQGDAYCNHRYVSDF